MVNIVYKKEELEISEDFEFGLDSITPLCYKFEQNNIMSILYKVVEDATDNVIYLLQNIKLESQEDIDYFKNNPINYDNIKYDPEKLNVYKEEIRQLSNGNLYKTDFDMYPDESRKKFFVGYGFRKDELAPNKFIVVKLLIPKYQFIKIMAYLNELFIKLPSAAVTFHNPKYNSLEFIKVQYVKFNGSWSDIGSNVVTSNFTLGKLPSGFKISSLYKVNYITPRLRDRLLKKQMSKEQYLALYKEDFLISNIIYEPHEDKVYLIYDNHEDNRVKFTKTIVFVLDKEFYEQTNLIDHNFIYSEEKTIYEEEKI